MGLIAKIGINIVRFSFDIGQCYLTMFVSFRLKVLANKKRGGLTVVSFDRSLFMLFSRKFSNKLMQVPSCERPRKNCLANPVFVV